MNIIKNIFKEKKNRINEIRSYYQPLGKAVWSDRNYEMFSREAYIKNVVSYKCISMLARNASSIPFLLFNKQTNEDICSHQILDLLNNPNPIQNRIEFFEALYSYKLISGNSFVKAVFLRSENFQNPKELFILRPDRMSIVAGEFGIPIAYEYKVNSHKSTFYVDKLTGKSEILHIKTFNPINDWYGLSPVEAASYAIDQHNESSKWNQAMLQNGAKPSGALMVKGDGDNPAFLSDEQFDRLKRQLNEEFSGSENTGKPLLLEGGLEWKEMSLSPADMDFLDSKHSCARDIAMAFGVPSQLLGIPGDNTYSNLTEARLAMWEETILPMVENILTALNNWLIPMFGEDIELYYDKDKISALSSRQESYWNKIASADFLSDEEKKKLLDL
ncbi:MAG TPA: phage portal protein [Rickettsiales bacterium]|nr:phage portal protein [Rickettsiales bacterium]